MINDIRQRAARCALLLAAALIVWYVRAGRGNFLAGLAAGVVISLADLNLLVAGLQPVMSAGSRGWRDFLLKNPYVRFGLMGMGIWLMAGVAGVSLAGMACGLVAGLAASVGLIGRCAEHARRHNGG